MSRRFGATDRALAVTLGEAMRAMIGAADRLHFRLAEHATVLTKAKAAGAARFFARMVREIEQDLGGRRQLSRIQRELIRAFAGAATTLQYLNVQVALGETSEIDLSGYATIASTMLRIGSRLGTHRVSRDVTAHLCGAARACVMNIMDAVRDQKVFAPHFCGNSWDGWLAFLCALFALPMTQNSWRSISGTLVGARRPVRVRMKPGWSLAEGVGSRSSWRSSHCSSPASPTGGRIWVRAKWPRS